MKRIVQIIIAVILWVLSLGVIVDGVTQKDMVIIVMGIIFGLIGLKVSGLLPKERQKKNKEKERLEEMGYLESAKLTLESGLSISEKVSCKLTYCKDRLIIEGSGVTYSLPTNRIIDIGIKSRTEIETFYNSSIGGAVGGAIAIGPLGAMIGGRKKKKEIKKTEYFLVITYDKDDEVNFIVFNIDMDPLKARKFVAIFKKSGIKYQKTVDL